MFFLRALPVLALSSFLLGAGTPDRSLGRLHYRIRIQFQGDANPVETRCVLEPTPSVETHNRAKKPRMGGWRLEAEQRKGEAASVTAILARVERLLYFSGPSVTTVPRSILVRFGERRCPVWQLQVPDNLQVYAYLAEVSPGLLALSYLSGSFRHGDLTSVEIQLEDFQLSPGAGPAEDGTALMTTLQRMASAKVDALSTSVDGAPERVSPE